MAEQIAITQPTHKFEFSLADFAASQTDTVVPTNGGIVNTHVMWKDGSILGSTVQLSAAITAGSLDAEVFVNNVDTGIDIVMDTAATTEFKNSYVRGTYNFQAGQTLGVKYTSDGSLAPTTSDGLITIYVIYNDIREP